jgi:hypothetical protein
LFDTAGKAPGTYSLQALLGGASGTSRAATIWSVQSLAIDAEADTPEQEPNNSPGAAQRLSLPAIVNGRIDPPSDEDVYRVETRGGSSLVAEVQARRLGSPLDSTLEVLDSAGRPVGFNDDCEDKSAGLVTHHADARLAFTVPADGVCLVRVRDAQGKGGKAYAYRLHIDTPRPDFALRVTPSSVNLRGRTPLVVHALRRDGFAGDITLAIDGAPPGTRLSETRLPAGKDELKLTVNAPAAPADAVLNLHLRGQATINGATVVHEAVPAEDMMQAFAYRHLVPALDWLGSTGRGFGGGDRPKVKP